MCPDCRFVFRVPRDHDGQGVVCPSCRRILKIPVAGDRPPPLVLSLRSTPVEEPPQDPGSHPHGSQRRTKKSRHAEGDGWGRAAGTSRRSGRAEKRQMLWMLIGGGSLFALIVTGVLLALRGSSAPAPQMAGPAVGKPAPVSIQPAATAAAGARRPEAEFLAEAEPLARKFLDATRIEDLLALVRNPGVAQARMRQYYPAGKIEAPGLSAFNTDFRIVRLGTISALKLRTRNYDEKSLAYVETPQGLKIDWESWAGWSEMPWDEFLATKPTTAQRVPAQSELPSIITTSPLPTTKSGSPTT